MIKQAGHFNGHRDETSAKKVEQNFRDFPSHSGAGSIVFWAKNDTTLGDQNTTSEEDIEIGLRRHYGGERE